MLRSCICCAGLCAQARNSMGKGSPARCSKFGESCRYFLPATAGAWPCRLSVDRWRTLGTFNRSFEHHERSLSGEGLER